MNPHEKRRLLTSEELSGTAVVANGAEDLTVRRCRVRYSQPTGEAAHPDAAPTWEDLYGVPACAEGVAKLTRQRVRRNPPHASDGG